MAGDDRAGRGRGLGLVGVWAPQLRRSRCGRRVLEAAAELEELGFGALWVPGGSAGGDDVLDDVAGLLGATTHVTVATGILSIWAETPATVARRFGRLVERHPGRVLLGLGVSHVERVAWNTGRERGPLGAMEAYLDALDSPASPVPPSQRVLAALGPRMLELAAQRSRGAHPYLVPAEHTRRARRLLGTEPLLAPEQAVVIDRDVRQARAAARRSLTPYLDLSNYTRNLRRLGFGGDDFRDGGSDRLIDSLFACGDPSVVAARVEHHLAAGADHVCVQVAGSARDQIPMAGWRRAAEALSHLLVTDVASRR